MRDRDDVCRGAQPAALGELHVDRVGGLGFGDALHVGRVAGDKSFMPSGETRSQRWEPLTTCMSSSISAS